MYRVLSAPLYLYTYWSKVRAAECTALEYNRILYRSTGIRYMSMKINCEEKLSGKNLIKLSNFIKKMAEKNTNNAKEGENREN